MKVRSSYLLAGPESRNSRRIWSGGSQSHRNRSMVSLPDAAESRGLLFLDIALAAGKAPGAKSRLFRYVERPVAPQYRQTSFDQIAVRSSPTGFLCSGTVDEPLVN